MKKMNKKGFTIVELVIVIAVIAILAAVLIPTFDNVVNKAKENKALQEAKNAYTATLAEDLSTEVTTDDVVYGKGEIIVHHENGTKIKISAAGAPSVVATGDATHKLEDGKLVAVSAPASCNCDEKCTAANEDCPVCATNHASCTGE